MKGSVRGEGWPYVYVPLSIVDHGEFTITDPLMLTVSEVQVESMSNF